MNNFEAIDLNSEEAKQQVYKPKANVFQYVYYRLNNSLLGNKYYWRQFESKHPNYETNGIISTVRQYY